MAYPPNPDAGLYGGYENAAPVSVDELLAFIRAAAAQHKGYYLRATLDDMNQAGYTSAHSQNKYDLYYGEEDEDLDFKVRLERFLATKTVWMADNATGHVLDSERGWEGGEPHIDILAANQNPDLFLDREISVSILPCHHSEDVMASFPNGYFVGDLGPFENHELAKYMRTEHGFDLFGIGASYLGFLSKNALDGSGAKALAADMARLYEAAEANVTTEEIAKVLTGKDRLFLRYSE